MKKIVYIPLDDRPVCYKRVKLLAESCGLEITIPKLEMCRTILDNQPKIKKKNRICAVFNPLLKVKLMMFVLV